MLWALCLCMLQVDIVIVDVLWWQWQCVGSSSVIVPLW